MAAPDPDLALRQAAITRAIDLREAYDDLVPREVLLQGFAFRGQRISFGSFQRGIHRPREMRGPAALSLMTAPPVPGKPRPYDDVFEPDGPVIYHYRTGDIDQPDNRALRAAHEFQSPLIYFLGIAPSQYMVVAPVFVAEDRPGDRLVVLEVGVPLADTQPGGPISTADTRAYALRQVKGPSLARRVREERDGPMLREGIQGFHGAAIKKPRNPADHPDPDRLATRFSRFEASVA
jgi:putative restriction endonuclease